MFVNLEINDTTRMTLAHRLDEIVETRKHDLMQADTHDEMYDCAEIMHTNLAVAQMLSSSVPIMVCTRKEFESLYDAIEHNIDCLKSTLLNTKDRNDLMQITKGIAEMIQLHNTISRKEMEAMKNE